MRSRIISRRTRSRPYRPLRTASVPCKSRSMQVRLRMWFLLVLSLGLSAIAVAQAAPKPAPKPLPTNKYCQPDGGFCFRYPASWSVLGEVFEGKGVVVAPAQKQEREHWDEVTVALV